jgi:hypothetical protein
MRCGSRLVEVERAGSGSSRAERTTTSYEERPQKRRRGLLEELLDFD